MTKNSPRALKQLKHTKINITPKSVMAVVPHHLPSKQIWFDCLIKPAALSAIHTRFLPAKYSIIRVKALEKQGNKGQSDLNVWSKNSLAYLSLKDVTREPIVQMQKLWQSSCRVPTKIGSSSRWLKVSPSSSSHGDVWIYTFNTCSKTPGKGVLRWCHHHHMWCGHLWDNETEPIKEPRHVFSVLRGFIRKLTLHPEEYGWIMGNVGKNWRWHLSLCSMDVNSYYKLLI